MRVTSCYLALDAGTGSLRAALYRVDDGRSVGAVDIPFALDIRGRREVSFLAVWEAVEGALYRLEAAAP